MNPNDRLSSDLHATCNGRPSDSVIETEGLVLTPPNFDVVEDVFRYSSDEKFCNYIDADPPQYISESRAFISQLISDNRSGKRCYWIIQMKDSGEAIGTIGFLYSFSTRHQVVEFGYGLATNHWGTGLFSEAADVVIRYGFIKLGIQKIQVFTRSTNLRSINSVRKLGFQEEGLLRRFYAIRGGRADCLVLGLDFQQFSTNVASELDK